MGIIVSAPSSTNTPPSYLYNPAGLQNFLDGIRYAGVDMGGYDVVILGDSTSIGYGITNQTDFSIPHILRRKMQARLNPIGPDGNIIGGMGLIRPGYSAYGFAATQYAPYVGSDLFGRTGLRLSPNLTGTIVITCNDDGVSSNPAVASTAFPYASDLELVVTGGSLYGVISLDANYGDAGYGEAQALNVGSTSRAGMRGGLLPTGDGAWSQSSLPTSGNDLYRLSVTTAAGKYSDISGIIHYRFDRNAGIRFHPIGITGDTTRKYVPTTKTLIGGVAGLITAGDVPALSAIWDFDNATNYDLSGLNNKRAGLYIIMLGDINEYQDRANATGGPDVYREGLQYIVEQIHAASPNASILLVNWWQGSAYQDDATTLPRKRKYNDAAKAVVNIYPGWTSLVDLFTDTNRSLREGSETFNHYISPVGAGGANSLEQADGIHPNAAGSEYIAERLYQALTYTL
jgi:lysophospholipase L1-like esterase